jgi:hypothetical protein
MIWETRGDSLYATRAGKGYLITHYRTGTWVLRQHWLADEYGWDVIGEYYTQQEAKDAAT